MNKPINTILAIETSCDETAAAIVRNGTEILGKSVANWGAEHIISFS